MRYKIEIQKVSQYWIKSDECDVKGSSISYDLHLRNKDKDDSCWFLNNRCGGFMKSHWENSVKIGNHLLDVI